MTPDPRDDPQGSEVPSPCTRSTLGQTFAHVLLTALLGVILLPARGLATLGHQDLEQGPSFQRQLDCRGCHGSRVLLQAQAKRGSPGRQPLLLQVLFPRAPGTFSGPRGWPSECSRGCGRCPPSSELPFFLWPTEATCGSRNNHPGLLSATPRSTQQPAVSEHQGSAEHLHAGLPGPSPGQASTALFPVGSVLSGSTSKAVEL